MPFICRLGKVDADSFATHGSLFQHRVSQRLTCPVLAMLDEQCGCDHPVAVLSPKEHPLQQIGLVCVG